jgi:hypothetical protein
LNIGLRVARDWRPPSFSHGRSIERDAVGIVDEPVEDGVSKRWFANDLMPGVNRQLAGDDG